jgi:hypothetical protein
LSCPKLLRQTFHEWALHSVAYSQWACEYYNQQRAKGKRGTRQSARWLLSGVAYYPVVGTIASLNDEVVYQQALARRRPNAPTEDAAVQLQWKTIAGFSKFVASGA